MPVLALASMTALLGQPEAREITRQAVDADESNRTIARSYSVPQRVELRGSTPARG